MKLKLDERARTARKKTCKKMMPRLQQHQERRRSFNQQTISIQRRVTNKS